MAEPHTLLVFSNPVTGQEAEYQDWYRSRHLGEVTSIDGVAFGRFFEIVDLTGSGPMPWTHMARYAVADAPADVVARVYEANASGAMEVPEWITDVGAWFFTATDPSPEPWEQATGDMSLALDRDARSASSGARAWSYSGVPFDPEFPSPWQSLITSATPDVAGGEEVDGRLAVRLRPVTAAVVHAG